MPRYLRLTLAVAVLLLLPVSVFAQDTPPEGFRNLTTSDRLLSMDYPVDWVAALTPGQTVVLATDESLFEGFDPESYRFAPGEASLSLMFISSAHAEESGLLGDTLLSQLAYVMQITTPEDNEENPRITFGDIEALELSDGNAGFQVNYAILQDLEGSLYIWNVTEDLTVLATLSAAPGEAQALQEPMLHVIDSVVFSGTVEAVFSEDEE